MRHVITLASRYWKSKINYLHYGSSVRKREVESEDQIIFSNVYVNTNPAVQRVNLSEVATRPRVYVAKLFKALNGVAIQRVLDLVIFVEDEYVRVFLAVPKDAFTLKLNAYDRRPASQEPRFPP